MTFVRGHFRRTRSGYTYVRPSARRSSSGAGVLLIASAVAIGLVISLVAAIVRFMVEQWIPIVGTMLAGGALAGGVALTGGIKRRRVGHYLELAREVVDGADGGHEKLARLAKWIPADDQQRVVGEEEIYSTLIAEILADGEITDEECNRLNRIDGIFVFDPRRAIEIRQEAFDGFVSWVGVDLTEEQEAALHTVAARLEIPQAHTEHWLTIVAGRRIERERQVALAAERERQAALLAERERQAALLAERERQAMIVAEQERRETVAAERQRQTALAAERERQAQLEAERERRVALEVERERQAALSLERRRKMETQRDAARAIFETARREPVDVDVKLKRGELCWLSTQASLRDRKEMRSGVVFVTNKRLLFVADTTVSISLSQMLDVGADPHSGVLRVIKDGRKTPYEFTLEQPLVLLAHLERSRQEVNEGR
jgi:hypothetical protein